MHLHLYLFASIYFHPHFHVHLSAFVHPLVHGFRNLSTQTPRLYPIFFRHPLIHSGVFSSTLIPINPYPSRITHNLSSIHSFFNSSTPASTHPHQHQFIHIHPLFLQSFIHFSYNRSSTFANPHSFTHPHLPPTHPSSTQIPTLTPSAHIHQHSPITHTLHTQSRLRPHSYPQPAPITHPPHSYAHTHNPLPRPHSRPRPHLPPFPVLYRFSPPHRPPAT